MHNRYCSQGAERKIRDEGRKKKMSESETVTKTDNNNNTNDNTNSKPDTSHRALQYKSWFSSSNLHRLWMELFVALQLIDNRLSQQNVDNDTFRKILGHRGIPEKLNWSIIRPYVSSLLPIGCKDSRCRVIQWGGWMKLKLVPYAREGHGNETENRSRPANC